MRKLDLTDALAGGFFVFAGLAFGWISLGLDLGTAFRMGPGYFPLVLSGLLILLGLVVLAGAARSANGEIGAIAWRGMLFLLPAPVLFALTIRGLGFVPALFCATMLAGYASPKMRFLEILALAAAVTLFATAVFSYGLGLPFRRFGPWLGF
jgi:hypothetical protein